MGDLPHHLSEEINLSILWPVLRSSNIFEGIPRQCAVELAYHLQPSTKLPGEMVFKHGQQSASLYILLSGEVQLHMPSTGLFIDERLLWKYSKGDVVGSPGVVFDCLRCGDAWSKG